MGTESDQRFWMKGENVPFAVEGYEEENLVSYYSPAVYGPECSVLGASLLHACLCPRVPMFALVRGGLSP